MTDAQIKFEMLKEVAAGKRPWHPEDLANEVLAIWKSVNQAERLISEALRVGCGRGDEYVKAAHTCLTGTGIVTGYTKGVTS